MQGKLNHVEMLRGLAALSVTWFHLTNGHKTEWLRASGSWGWLGVDCFFVISGFIIPFALNRSDYSLRKFGAFMLRRLVRLEPPYIASIALVIVLAAISTRVPGFRGEPVHYSPAAVASHLLYLAPLFQFSWINPVYWTLAYEFVFYISAGLLFPVLARRPLVLTGLVVTAVALLSPGREHFLDERVMLFLLGIAAFRRHAGIDGNLMFLSCLGVTAGLIMSAGAWPTALVGVTTALILTHANLPVSAPLAWLGTVSYSLYLLHVPIGGRVVNLGRRFGDSPLTELMSSLAGLAVSLAAAWMFWRLIESPSTALARRLTGRPQSRAPAASEAEA